MLCRKKQRGIVVLCLVVSVWKIYKSVYLGPSSSSNGIGEWSTVESFLEGKPCSYNRCFNLSNPDWFCEHYNASVNCLLNPKNPMVPSGVQQWWLKLQGSQNGSQLREIIKNLFDTLSSPSAKVQDIAHCGTCSVVGNSGNLRGSKYGEKIDSHNFVLRMNKAPTAGFEEDVGAKTTHHFMYPESAVNLHPGVHLVLVPFKPLDLKWLASALSSGDIQHTYKRVKQFIKADKSKVLILNPAFLKYIQEKWTKNHGKYPSTGLIALIFAIHTCTRVSVFGFGADNSGNWHHYWEENRDAGAFHKTGVHNAVFEQRLIERLATEGKVSLFR
ncbi:PREDICTED: CMP-N-acetylneuraminate-beta-galactosamide-alpha-2,3-sialyltransferase 2-like [Gekko japonicus]|uniref:beta-galactoside alpha-2,3-sialyltransferase n=1 Tax=Gekko japonicus TaxID=146911 RepID=A0ABM1JQG6_GEKJA|nr:PREDICTED: CMP-N-acetylneuraminate-beta-galactosamide-alpha-2,3-sialyltransferase 2-like [Gekko japonicus]